MFSSAKSAIVILFVIILSFVAIQNSVGAPFGGGGGGEDNSIAEMLAAGIIVRLLQQCF